MIPTPNNLHWNRHWSPDIDYSFKHSFSWPHAADSSKLADGTAAAAEGAASGFTHTAHGSGGPPRGRMHYHMYGRGGYPFVPRRRFGGRLFWFGAGIGAAALYYRHKERHREWERAIASGEVNQDKMAGWGWKCENTRGQAYAPTPSAPSASSPPPPTRPVAVTTPTPPHYAAPAWQPARFDQQSAAPTPVVPSPPTESAILAAIQHSSAPIEVIEPPDKDTNPRWGWGERRRRRQEAKEAVAEEKQRQEEAAKQAAKIAAVQEQGKEEMKRLREVMESLWNDRKVVAATAQVQANEKAKEYAREKLEKLSVALDSLRESLNDDREKEKKLV